MRGSENELSTRLTQGYVVEGGGEEIFGEFVIARGVQRFLTQVVFRQVAPETAGLVNDTGDL